MRRLRLLTVLGLLVWIAAPASGQIVEFESGGLRYQTLTMNGLTIMFAHLPAQVRQYGILQVAVSNGSSAPWTVRPDDFRLEFTGGNVVHAVPALQVINELVQDASGDDVISLVTTYEAGLLGVSRIRSTKGYEQRRQSAIAMGSPKRLMAAAAASAIAFVETMLRPGESTDGAVFYPVSPKPEGEFILKVSASGHAFEFGSTLPLWAPQ